MSNWKTLSQDLTELLQLKSRIISVKRMDSIQVLFDFDNHFMRYTLFSRIPDKNSALSGTEYFESRIDRFMDELESIGH